MKPFITPDVLPDGSRMYSAQCEGLQLVEMPGCVLNREIIAYYLPGKQSLSAAWIFRLAFDNSFALEFSSACTMIDGWNEVGSINVKLIDFANQGDSSLDAILMRFDIRPFRVTSLAKLLFEGKNFSSECGIVFEGGGREILIATGISPGSISVAADFSESLFNPEFSISECRRERLSVL